MARPPRESRAERRARRAEVDDPAEVMAAAARFLEVRPRSMAEVRRRLADQGYRADLIEGAVERLAELGYLDDAEFARAWVESRDRARPRGTRALRDELRRKGLPAEIVDDALAARDEGDGAASDGAGPDAAGPDADDRAAAALLARRASALARVTDPRVRRQRAYALLARNGFDPDTAARAAATLAETPDA